MKSKNLPFVCSSCRNEYAKWSGQCLHCKQWNTILERQQDKKAQSISKLKKFGEINENNCEFWNTGLKSFDQLTGGGLALGGFYLLGELPVSVNQLSLSRLLKK